MSSLKPSFLAALAMPPRVAGLLRRLGEHQGRQQLHQQQAPEILEKACPMVSRDMIRHVLFDLKKANLVECLGRSECLGRRRSAKWRKIG